MDDEDLNKYFKSIYDILVDDNKYLYICDSALHQVRIFDSEWNYLKTIGKKGKGPGDFIGPTCLGSSRGIDLAVLEFQGMRIQLFDKIGQSKSVIKLKSMANWMAINSANEFVLYNSFRTFRFRKLLYVIDKKAQLIREIGNYHDPSQDFLDSETFHMAIDDYNNIYVANCHAPVIRKYSPNGKLLQCITFEMPFKIPDVTVEVFDSGNDVKILNKGRPPKRGGDGKLRVDSDNLWISCISRITVDSQQRIFIVSTSRLLPKEEYKKIAITSMAGMNGIMNINRPQINIEEYPEYVRMMVFDRNGKIIATSPLKLPFSSPRVKGNRLYVVDDVLEPGVWEYEFSIDVKTK